MRKTINIDEIAAVLLAEKLNAGKDLPVRSVVASGLMSDVLTTDKEDFLLVSNLSSPQVVRTADMTAASAVLITNGKPVTVDTVSLAKEVDICLLRTDCTLFEACCLLGGLFMER